MVTLHTYKNNTHQGKHCIVDSTVLYVSLSEPNTKNYMIFSSEPGKIIIQGCGNDVGASVFEKVLPNN